MAARNRKGLSEATRQRIQTTMIVKRLEKHILATPEKDKDTGKYVIKDLMTQSQVSAALGLIKKTLPDLTSVELKAEVSFTDERELTDEQLANIATSGSKGAVEAENSEEQLH